MNVECIAIASRFLNKLSQETQLPYSYTCILESLCSNLQCLGFHEWATFIPVANACDASLHWPNEWFIGQLKPNLLITTSITLVAAKIICPRPLQPCNLKCLAQSALHINLPLGFRQEQTWLFIFILNDSNVRRFENVNCNTCICSVGSKSLTPKYLRPSNPVGVQFGTSIRKYGNTDPYFYICLGLYHLFGILG